MDFNNRQKWKINSKFFSILKTEFRFQVDVAASKRNSVCSKYINESMNSLSPDVRWVDSSQKIFRAWCNPPFRHMMPWVKKAYSEVCRVKGSVVCVLAPLSGSAWFEFIANGIADEIRIIVPRVPCIPAKGIKESSPRGDLILAVFRNIRKNAWTDIHVFNWKRRLHYVSH